MHGNEHTLPVFPLYKDVIELYARTKTAYTPTLLVNYGGIIAEEYFYATTEVHDDRKLNRFYPHNVLDDMTRRRRMWARKDEFVFPLAAEAGAKIQRAGGLVGVGGHGQLQGLGYHWEMWALAMGGMTPREVLKAATIDGAKIIGVDQDLGSIEAGKLADLVVLDRNPLVDIRNTNSVRVVDENAGGPGGTGRLLAYVRSLQPSTFSVSVDLDLECRLPSTRGLGDRLELIGARLPVLVTARSR